MSVCAVCVRCVCARVQCVRGVCGVCVRCVCAVRVSKRRGGQGQQRASLTTKLCTWREQRGEGGERGRGGGGWRATKHDTPHLLHNVRRQHHGSGRAHGPNDGPHSPSNHRVLKGRTSARHMTYAAQATASRHRVCKVGNRGCVCAHVHVKRVRSADKGTCKWVRAITDDWLAYHAGAWLICTNK